MKTTKIFAGIIMAAVAAAAALAGDSAPFLLDMVEGTRIATDGVAETIAYSPYWNGAADCSVAVDGTRLLSNAIDEGELFWTPRSPGRHVLTHTAGGETLTATFVSVDDNVVLHGGVLSAGETWAADKTHLVTAPFTIPGSVMLTIESGAVVKFMDGTSLTVASDGAFIARGVVFTHVADDTAGGDTMTDGDETAPEMGKYAISGTVTDDDSTEYRYMHMPPQTLSSSISSDTQLRGYRMYVVSNSVTVASGATLTLQPGTILKFDTGCSLTVAPDATLDARGTRAAPIIFTSLKDDEHGGDTNGDGKTTTADYGDWYQIKVQGTATFDHCSVLYNSSTENYGGVEAYGGTVTFDNGEIAHCRYECVNAHSSGTFTARNSAFWDGSLGFGYYGGERVRAHNCVFQGLATAIRQGGKQLVNCVFSDCVSFTDQSGDGSTFDHCVFWNPAGFGAQSYSKVGSSGNVWGDPLFEDPENGDFRIAANSPCVDAADSTAAPEFDFDGQPRMDVKRIQDTGIPDSDGVCADIGLYEVPGWAEVPMPDIAVVSVAVPAGGPFAPGDEIVVSYTVTNCGAVAAFGAVRDAIRLRGADAALGGQTAEAGEALQTYALAPGARVEVFATIAIPALREGAWRLGVEANPHRDIFEQNLSNNGVWSEATVAVALEALPPGKQSVTVEAGGTATFSLAGLPASGGAVLVSGAGAAAVAARGGNGAVPAGDAGPCATVALDDGKPLVVFPAREEGEGAYLVLENGGAAEVTVSVEVAASGLALYEASPKRVANVGDATITLTGCGLGDGTAVTLGGRAAKSVAVLNAAQVAATFDVDGMAAGRYSVAAGSATLPNAVEIYATKTGPKLTAWLETPPSVRDGRVFTGYVCYRNDGDSPMSMPVFKVTRTDSTTRLGLVASESMDEGPIWVGGISATHPAGILKPGDEGRVPFYFQPFGQYKIRLTHLIDVDNAEMYPAFGGTKAFLAAVSAAATRLNLRGRRIYDIDAFSDQSLDEANGVSCAAVSGRLLDAITGEPLAGTGISLVDAAGPDADEARLDPSAGVTDDGGYFSLAGLADGEYRFLLEGGASLAVASTGTVSVAGGADVNGMSVLATPGGRVRGYVLAEGGRPVAETTVSLLDEGGSVYDATETDGFGAFSFDGLHDGVYAVRTMPNDGYFSATAEGLTIDATARLAEAVVEVRRGASVGGTVTFGGEPVTNGTVQIITEDGTSIQTHCGTNGVYLFDGVAPDSYAVRYYSSELESDDVWVTLGYGGKASCDLEARPRPLFAPTRSLGYGSCEVTFFFTDAARAADVTSWAWDFDSDGKVDSTEAEPTWVYSAPGTNTVTLTITEAAGQTTSVYPGCVVVERELETILAAGAIVFGENEGTLATVEVGENTLVLSGEPRDGAIVVGSVILGEMDGEWYCRRVTGVARDGGLWRLTTTGATWDEAYEQCTLSATGWAEETPRRRSAATRDGGGFKLYGEGGVDVNLTVNPFIGFECQRSKAGGNVKERFAFVGRLSVAGELAFQGTVGAKFTREFPAPIFIVIPTPVPGMTMENAWKVYVEGDVHAKGSASVGGDLSTALQLGCEWEKGKKARWLKPFDATSNGHAHGDVEGSASVKLGVKPEFKAKLAGTASAVMAVDAYIKAEVTATTKAPATAGISMGLDLVGELNLIDWNYGIIDAKLGVRGTVAGPHVDILKWYGPKPDFSYFPKENKKAPATVNFTDNSEEPHLQMLGAYFGAGITGYEWSFGNGSKSTAQNPSTTYEKEGTYMVTLKAKGIGINGPYRCKKSVTVGEKGPPPPPPPPNDGEDGDDEDSGDSRKSWDPNEMAGPLGFGDPDTERFLVPGEWATYTIYFENKTNATADAQQVVVDAALSPQLDWGTFEMLEVAFGNNVDAGLAGKANGTSSIAFGDAGRKVRTTVAFDGTTGAALWIMRVWDDAGMFGWPADDSGFLPPNDPDTHCGEGHITYRVKVRDDAEPLSRIDASATIVFDYNDPIPTDPAWWNTVAPMAMIALDYGSTATDGTATNLVLVIGQPYGELPTPAARAGAKFGGWFTGPNGTGRKVTAATLVQSGDSGLYAYWIPTYKIAFNANGGTGKMATLTVDAGATVKLTANAFKRSGCVFIGWAKTKTGAVAYANGASVKNLAAGGKTVTLYARWAVAKYTVAFNGYGGKLPKGKKMAPQAMVYGKAAKLRKNLFARKGYVFAGWAVSKAAAKKGIVSYVNAQAVKNLRTDGKTTVLYAVWAKPTYKVAFSGTVKGVKGKMAVQTFKYGKAAKLAANKFTLKGYKFAGWATSAANAKKGVVKYKNKAKVKSLVINGKTVKLYAVWKK